MSRCKNKYCTKVESCVSSAQIADNILRENVTCIQTSAEGWIKIVMIFSSVQKAE